VSLLLDYAFPAYPDNMGHWAEAILPIYNVLERGTWQEAIPGSSGIVDNLVFVNLKRTQLAVSWFCANCTKLSPHANVPRCPPNCKQLHLVKHAVRLFVKRKQLGLGLIGPAPLCLNFAYFAFR